MKLSVLLLLEFVSLVSASWWGCCGSGSYTYWAYQPPTTTYMKVPIYGIVKVRAPPKMPAYVAPPPSYAPPPPPPPPPPPSYVGSQQPSYNPQPVPSLYSRPMAPPASGYAGSPPMSSGYQMRPYRLKSFS